LVSPEVPDRVAARGHAAPPVVAPMLSWGHVGEARLGAGLSPRTVEGPMKRTEILGLGVLASILVALVCLAADFPAQQESSWVIRDFRFNTGETLPELRLHYRTLGSPNGEPVLILHGTTQSGAAMLGPAFGGELFGSGQPLDAARYYVILPDA